MMMVFKGDIAFESYAEKGHSLNAIIFSDLPHYNKRGLRGRKASPLPGAGMDSPQFKYLFF